MQKQRRNGRGATPISIEDEIAHLRGLNLKGLRSRWQGVFQRPAPAHLTQHLLFAVIAYRLQADRFGDLDQATRQMLDEIATKEAGPALVGGNLPLGYEMKDGKVAVIEQEAEQVRFIYRRYLELGSVNELVRDLGERDIRTKFKKLSTGKTRGGIPFGRGALYYLLSNHFYIGEVKYKNEILLGEQPPILDRALFEAVRNKALSQWSHRTLARSKSDHLLAGLLFDDVGHRMVPTHATKAGVRYRYYVSAPVLHGEAKTTSAGSISRVPAADVEKAVTKSLKRYLAEQRDGSTINATRVDDRDSQGIRIVDGHTRARNGRPYDNDCACFATASRTQIAS